LIVVVVVVVVVVEEIEPKREQVTADQRKCITDGFTICTLHLMRAIKSRRTGWAGHVAGTGERRAAYKILVMKSEIKMQLGKPRSIWNKIKVYVKEIDSMACTELIWLRYEWQDLVIAVKNLRVP
jgi:hypothetical protein